MEWSVHTAFPHISECVPTGADNVYVLCWTARIQLQLKAHGGTEGTDRVTLTFCLLFYSRISSFLGRIRTGRPESWVFVRHGQEGVPRLIILPVSAYARGS